MIALISLIATVCLGIAGYRVTIYLQHQQQLQAVALARLQQQLAEEGEERKALRARVNALRDTAGFLYTHLAGWALNQHAEELRASLQQFETFPAQFAEYPAVQRAIWAFQNTAQWIVYEHGTLLTEEQRRIRQHQDTIASQRGTTEEQEQRWQERRDESEHVRTVELPERYHALIAAAKALLEPPPPPPQISGWRRLSRLVARVAHRPPHSDAELEPPTHPCSPYVVTSLLYTNAHLSLSLTHNPIW